MISKFKRFQNYLSQYATSKNVIILFVITQLVYFLMILYTIPNLMSIAGGMKILDMLPAGYSYEYVNSLFTHLGDEGRDYYLFRQIPLDMIYPFLFTISYSLLLIYLFKKGFGPKSKIHYLSMIPLFAGLFDYCENIGIIAMLSKYPNISVQIAGLTNIFSILKSISTTLFFVLLLIGIFAVIIKKIRKPKAIN